MCHPTRCRQCGNTTWAGCGRHVSDVKAVVPPDLWCPGHHDPDNDGWLRRILGR
jgi:hypothetical protein